MNEANKLCQNVLYHSFSEDDGIGKNFVMDNLLKHCCSYFIIYNLIFLFFYEIISLNIEKLG